MYKNIIITLVVIIGIILLLIFVPKNAGAPAGESDTQMQTVSAQEVALHNTQDDCYSILDGKVYDLTGFIQQHPGGSNAIIGMCGIDATEKYGNAHGESKGAAATLAQFQIGILE